MSGAATLNGQPLDNGNAAMIYGWRISITAREDAELVMIEVQLRG